MTRYEAVVREMIARFKDAEKPMLGLGTAAVEAEYRSFLWESYVRTIRDIDGLWQEGEREGRKLLEIGSFLGTVSFSLKELGYDVTALDIPEFHAVEQSRQTYRQYGVDYFGVNLRHGQLPFANSSFDAVIACEVFEHFNFNPLPVLSEINRILKDGGWLYLAMPNSAHLPNRIKAMLGRSVRDPVTAYFRQLDRKENKIVAMHWREYTLAETVEMVSSMGFEVTKRYYFSERGAPKFPNSSLMSDFYHLCKSAILAVPSFRRMQVVIARKTHTPSYDFWFTEANR